MMKTIDIVMMKVSGKKGATLSTSEQTVRFDMVKHGELFYLM